MFGGARSPLLESANFADMFTDVARALKYRPDTIDSIITEARDRLKKNDRIVWFLRVWKVGFVGSLASRLPAGFFDRVAADYARRAHITEHEAKTIGWAVFNDPNLLHALGHYLSLPVPEIQHHAFAYETPERVLHLFKEAAAAYHADAGEGFEDDHAHEIMRFPNGLAWYDLGRSACDKEGKAMGHGGNAYRRGSGDTLLSLRRNTDLNEARHHHPVLTFVLDKNGLLGEMKGKFNDKPSQDYFNEIVALLKSPLVHGIKGGGYKPENNFSLNDLDPEVRNELLEAKPELGGLHALYMAHGIDDERVMTALEERLHSEHIAPPMLRPDGEGNMILQIWRDLKGFAVAQDDGLVVAMIDLIDGKTNLRPIDELNDVTLSSIIQALPAHHYQTLMQTLQVRPVPPGDMNFQRATMLAAQRLHLSPLYDMMVDAANESLNLRGDTKKIEDHLEKYVAVDWSFGPTHQWVDTSTSDGVELKIKVEDLINIATASEDHVSDYIHALHEIRERHWGRVDREMTASRRDEAGLSPIVSFDAKNQLDSDPFFVQMMSGSMLDVKAAGETFMRQADL